jgi:subtilase family serine protease
VGHRRSVVALSAAGLVAGLALPVAVAPSAGAAPSPMVRLSGSQAPAAARTTRVGAVPGDSPIGFQVVLAPRAPAAARQFATAVSTPGSTVYHHYLSASQWEARYSPTAAQVASVTTWLRQAGLDVGTVSADRMTVAASGGAAQVERTFATTLSLHDVGGRTLRLADTALSVPADLAGVVVGASGVSQTMATPDLVTDGPVAGAGADAAQPPGYRTAQPCGTYYGQQIDTAQPPYGHGYPSPAPYAVCGYTPPQLRSAYALPDRKAGGADGTGQTVAVIDSYVSPTLGADAAQYAAVEDPGHPYATGQFSELLPASFDDRGECQATGWYGEQTLDVEAVHATAPGAKILYVAAADCFDALYTSLQTVIDGGLANVITDSWGDDGGDLLDDVATRTSVDDMLTMAAGTGISVLFSSGDNGDEFSTLGFTSADYPASSPWVTAVGGTTLEVGATGHRTGETGWSTDRSLLCEQAIVGQAGCTAGTFGTWTAPTGDGGSGGGTSYEYTQPTYQSGVVPLALATRNSALTGNVPYRVVPDISMDADPGTGFLVGETQAFPGGTHYDTYRIGGTSVSSPLFAGTVAVADQVAGAPLGFLNPALYALPAKAPTTVYDTVPTGLQDQSRVDFVNSLSAKQGLLYSTRLIDYQGSETYCDGTGNCAKRPVDLSVLPGYDDMTGLGAPSAGFTTALGKA